MSILALVTSLLLYYYYYDCYYPYYYYYCYLPLLPRSLRLLPRLLRRLGRRLLIPPPCYDYKRPVCSGASFSRVPASNGQTVASAASQARRRWAPDKRVKGAMLRPGLLALNWYEHAVTFKGRNLLNMCRVAPPVLHKLLSASFGYPCYGDCCRTLLNSILL